MKTVTSQQTMNRALERATPAILILVRPGLLRIVHVAETDSDGRVCERLAADLDEELRALTSRMEALNR